MASVDEKINLLHQKLEHIQQMGGEKQVERQHSRGKLTARERLHLLFDENSFVETGALRKHNCHYFGQEKKDIPADGAMVQWMAVWSLPSLRILRSAAAPLGKPMQQRLLNCRKWL